MARIERDFGVEGTVMLGIWGIESAFADPLVQQNHKRPVIPSVAALAWGEPRLLAVQNFQRKIGMLPADGYAGVTLLARLREAR